MAPLFIAMFLFRQSKDVFQGWLKQLITFMLPPLFDYAPMTLFLVMIETLVAPPEAVDGALALNAVLGITVIMIVGRALWTFGSYPRRSCKTVRREPLKDRARPL